eukprot:gene60101-82231_t
MDDHLEAILAATAGETITQIFVTHNHMDHSPLARPLAARTGATIYACAQQGVPTEAEVRLEAGDDRVFEPDVGLCDGGVFKGGDWTMEAIPTPGHTSNHICYALHEENALFSGDHIMGWSTTVISPPDGDMGDYFDSLDRVKARNFTTLWPTHGPPITEPGPTDLYANLPFDFAGHTHNLIVGANWRDQDQTNDSSTFANSYTQTVFEPDHALAEPPLPYISQDD